MHRLVIDIVILDQNKTNFRDYSMKSLRKAIRMLNEEYVKFKKPHETKTV
jgi:hypothetical protein